MHTGNNAYWYKTWQDDVGGKFILSFNLKQNMPYGIKHALWKERIILFMTMHNFTNQTVM